MITDSRIWFHLARCGITFDWFDLPQSGFYFLRWVQMDTQSIQHLLTKKKKILIWFGRYQGLSLSQFLKPWSWDLGWQFHLRQMHHEWKWPVLVLPSPGGFIFFPLYFSPSATYCVDSFMSSWRVRIFPRTSVVDSFLIWRVVGPGFVVNIFIKFKRINLVHLRFKCSITANHSQWMQTWFIYFSWTFFYYQVHLFIKLTFLNSES